MIRFRTLPNLLLLALGIVVTAIGYVLVSPALDLPVRWGLDLQPTQTMLRNYALLQMPMAVAVVWLIVWAAQRFGNKDRPRRQVITLNWVLTGVTALLVAVQVLIVGVGLGLGAPV